MRRADCPVAPLVDPRRRNDDAVGRISDDRTSPDVDLLRVRDVSDGGGSDCNDNSEGVGDASETAPSSSRGRAVTVAFIASTTAIFQSSSSTFMAAAVETSSTVLVVFLVVFASFAGRVALLAGVTVVCCGKADEVLGLRAELRSAIVDDPLRAVASDDGACLRDVCGLDLAGAGLPDFFSAVLLDVGVVFAMLVDAVVLLDVEVIFADACSVFPPPLDDGTSISCTLASILDLDLTALSPFAADDLDAESPDFVALSEDGGGAPFTFRPDPDLAASFDFADDMLFAFSWQDDGISISCRVDGARDLARLVLLRDDDADSDSVTLVDPPLLSPFSVVVLQRSDDDGVFLTFDADVSSIASIQRGTVVDTAALAAAAAASAV